jgi:hypothetical protein
MEQLRDKLQTVMDSSDNSVIFDRPDMINGNKTTKVV